MMPSLPSLTDKLISLGLFIALSTLYFATGCGITSSNDGSHYALTRALVEHRSFEISDYTFFAEGNDLAKYDGKNYSDRPPGTALLTAPFYALARVLPPPRQALLSRHDRGNPGLLYILLVPTWAGSLTVVVAYWLMRELHVPIFSALTGSVMFAIGTAHWKYSSVLYSHALSSLIVMLSIYLTLRAVRHPHAVRWPLPLGLGFLLGYGVLVEYSNGLLVIGLALYIAAHLPRLPASKRLPYSALFLAGGALPALFLAYYNATNFGSPFTLSYTYAVNYPWAGNFRTTFSFPLLQGLRILLWWGEGGGWCEPTCYNQGLLLLSPVLLIAVLGWPRYARHAPRACALTTATFVVYLLLFATHHTSHGFTADGRYLVPFLGLLSVPLAYGIDLAYHRPLPPAWQALSNLCLYGLFGISTVNTFLHIGHSYNYTMNLAELSPLIASPQNYRYLLIHVFHNEGNLPILWGLETLLGGLIYGGLWLYHRQENHAP